VENSRVAVVIAVAVMAGVLAACGGTPSSGPEASRTSTGSDAGAGADVGAPTPGTPAGDAFYTPPTPLPKGNPGDVLRSRPWVDIPGARTTLVLYQSTDVHGKPVAVSGVVAVPDRGSPPAGGWPVLDWAHGTTGLGDTCAPSRDPQADSDLSRLVTAFTAAGFAVTATDYEGLGTPGGHPYVVGLSEGRGVLDMARAAARLPGSGIRATSPVVVWGHSQGGGASVFAAQQQPTYAPEVPLRGAVVGAPAAELRLLGTALQRSPFFGYMFLVAAGFRAAYPDLPLDETFTPAGLAEVDAAQRVCSDAALDRVRGQDPSRYLEADVGNTEPFASHLEQNTPGNIPTPVPMFVYHGDADEQIPAVASELMVRRMCARGGFTVHREVLPGQGHAQSIRAVLPEARRWIDDRLADRPAPSDCPG
jgi:alpha-beta hydrolase superfamily lysophospholipase